MGWMQILIVVALLVLLFGRGRISALMGDIAKGIRSFQSGMAEGEKPKTVAQKKTQAKPKATKSKKAKK